MTLPEGTSGARVEGSDSKNRIDVLGCGIDPLTLSETVATVDDLVQARIPVQHFFVNAATVLMLRKDVRLRGIVQSCRVVNADGQSVVWASKALGRPLPERVAGPDLLDALLTLAETRRYRTYFLGARQDVIESLVARLHHTHPHLVVAGYRNGYWHSNQSDEVVLDVRRARPDILIVGITSPLKDYWLAENLRAMAVPFSIGVGGCFDLLVGKLQRAPLWMQNAGMEWLFRLIQEPARLWRRYLPGNTVFVALVAESWIRERCIRGSTMSRTKVRVPLLLNVPVRVDGVMTP